MEQSQKHLAWLFLAYGLIELFDWIGNLSLWRFPPLAESAAAQLGMGLEAVYLKSGMLLFFVGFLVINSLYIARYLLKNPHLAKVPVGVTYSIIAMVGYAWLWILQGILYGHNNLFLAGAFHLLYALVLGIVAEHLPKHESVVVTVKEAKAKASSSASRVKKGKKKRGGKRSSASVKSQAASQSSNKKSSKKRTSSRKRS